MVCRKHCGAGLAGNITFLSSTTVCLNFERVLSSFQQKVLSDQVNSSKYHSLQNFLWVSVVLL